MKVRLLVDAMGTFLTPWRFLRPIIDAGGEVAKFLPISLWRGLYHANLRNHRKILVVDGKVGFTGGLNVGNEYGGWRRRRFGPWRDTHVELKGPAVAALQDVFVEDWHFTTGKEVEAGAAFPTIEPAGPELVHVVASGPDCDWEVIHHAIFTTITQATDHIYLTTPTSSPTERFWWHWRRRRSAASTCGCSCRPGATTAWCARPADSTTRNCCVRGFASSSMARK